MKKTILSLLLLSAAACGQAQQIVQGDMNNDADVSIGDVARVVDVVLHPEKKTILDLSGKLALVDNAMIQGTWSRNATDQLVFAQDGTFPTGGTGFTYEYLPLHGHVVIRNAEGMPATMLHILYVRDGVLYANRPGQPDILRYVKKAD